MTATPDTNRYAFPDDDDFDGADVTEVALLCYDTPDTFIIMLNDDTSMRECRQFLKTKLIEGKVPQFHTMLAYAIGETHTKSPPSLVWRFDNEAPRGHSLQGKLMFYDADEL